MPIAHGEGRFLFPEEKEQQMLEKLIDNDMVVFRYCDENGNVADGKYPTNPNGASTTSPASATAKAQSSA